MRFRNIIKSVERQSGLPPAALVQAIAAPGANAAQAGVLVATGGLGPTSAGALTRDGRARIGWVLSGLAIAFLLMDATMKLLALPVVLEASVHLGFPGADMARGLGTALLICTLLYASPRTAVLGAILLTGYLGGAVATHVRVGSPLFSHVLFGVYLGTLLWGGLYLRDARIRALIPFNTANR